MRRRMIQCLAAAFPTVRAGETDTMRALIERWVTDDTPLKRVLTARSWMIRAYFELRYLIPDPWHLATSDYEWERAETTLAFLGDRRYARVLEVGCGEGFFTARLLARCDRITAVDFSALALRRARGRFTGNTRVEVMRLDVLRKDPPGTFDLIVCAELFYYMSRDQFESVAPRIVRWLAPGGDLLLVHGISAADAASTDSHTCARQIHGHFCRMLGLVTRRDLVRPRYRLTLLQAIAA
jgi:SAM-dependent methyltransferase